MGNNILREVKIGAQLGKGHLNIVKPRDLILTRCAYASTRVVVCRLVLHGGGCVPGWYKLHCLAWQHTVHAFRMHACMHACMHCTNMPTIPCP
jgi:hypothetical protein